MGRVRVRIRVPEEVLWRFYAPVVVGFCERDVVEVVSRVVSS